MCGILAIASASTPSVTDAQAARMRDRLAHRGPDDAALERLDNVILAHRRLAVIDPTPAGRQPMATPDGRFALIYNGELYNDAELRSDLEREGVAFRTECDTETVLHALAHWGPAAATRLRGMYALALLDRRARILTLARDPLGIKPLYLWKGQTPNGPELVAASEIPAILEHPAVSRRPDLCAISAYLTTIHPVMGERTLFEGIRALAPGEWLTINLADRALPETSRDLWPEINASAPDPFDTHELVADSVTRHLRADVPTCCLLSGGLDSSIVCAVARAHADRLQTYCSGAKGDPNSDDFAHARLVADHLGTDHTEAPVTRELFAARWEDMVSHQGLPLSTPNEVAINEVARTLRARGNVVTLSGEGADELFAGYEMPMAQAWEQASGAPHLPSDPAEFQLLSNAWIPPAGKAAVLREPIARAIEGDSWLLDHYRRTFAAVARAPLGTPRESDTESRVQAHLRFHRRINLANLLRRLDSATMLESVEGRTPFADVQVCARAERLAMARKFRPGNATAGAGTKIALRESFARDLPPEVVSRPKASFPLPFQAWVEDRVAELDRSALAREVFTPEAIELVRTRPGEAWHLAWPMLNVALWGRLWLE